MEIKTAEVVTPKHPDKLCDRISDAILDECIKQDPLSRVAVETMGGHGIVTVTGEITTNAYVDIPVIVKEICGNIGVQTNIVKQSNEISQGVDTGGAGDQGIMVGYACEGLDMIPEELYIARHLAKTIYKHYEVDGKTQITLRDGKIDTIVASFCNVKKKELESIIYDWFGGTDVKIFANPAGDWTQGGFDADTGVTGRKLAVDNYGPQIPIGGGAFSGKDPSKVDRSGAYMARKIAVDYLKKHKAREILVKLAYSIGIAEPVMAIAEVDGKIIEVKEYDLTPKGIIKQLNLLKPIYSETAKWGHFGNGFNWDK